MAQKNGGEKLVDWGLVLLLGIGFVIQLYILYFGYNYYHYIVPPGYDVIPHYITIEKILSSGSIANLSYPPLFHLIVIGLSKLSHQDVFHILTYWTPVLVILPSLALYFLLRQIFERRVSVITTLIFLLTSGYPIFAFVDGNYPDILAYGVFGTLMFALLIRYFKTNRILNLIGVIILLILIALTHHFTFFNVGIILLVYSLINLGLIIYHRQFRLKHLLITFGILVAALISYFIIQQFYGGIFDRFYQGLMTNEPAIKNAWLSKVVEYADYPVVNGNIIWYGGLLGLFYMLVSSFAHHEENKTKQLVIIWILYFYLLSRFSSAAVPARFARELAIPLGISLAFLLNYVINLNPLRQLNYKVLFGYFVIGFLIVTNSAFYSGIIRLPESFGNLIWFWPKDQDKINYLAKTIDQKEAILYNPKANLYFPIKTQNSLVELELSGKEEDLAQENLKKPSLTEKAQYKQMIESLKQKYANTAYIFIDVKPPSNPDEVLYFHYAGFSNYNKVLNDLASSGQIITTFPDGAKLVKIDFNAKPKTTKTN